MSSTPIVGIHEDGEGHWDEMMDSDPDYMQDNYPDWEPEQEEEQNLEEDHMEVQ